MFPPTDKPITPQLRIPRVNHNIRNESNELFKFGGIHDYRTVKDRFNKDIAAEEKSFQHDLRNKRMHRNDIRRAYVHDIDDRRWQNYADHLQKDNAIIERRRNAYPPGKSGVAYDIISNNYLPCREGADLKTREQLVRSYKQEVALTNYLKNNSYNPIQGYDVASAFKPDN